MSILEKYLGGGTESQIVDNIPETETIYFNTINWGIVVLVGIVSFLICAAVILCTYNFQFKQDVKKMLKEEENKKIVEKCSAEIPQRIVLQPNPAMSQVKQEIEQPAEEEKRGKEEASKKEEKSGKEEASKKEEESIKEDASQKVEGSKKREENKNEAARKMNGENNSSKTPIRIVLPPRPPMPPTSKK